jgi:hypothetical protein
MEDENSERPQERTATATDVMDRPDDKRDGDAKTDD